MSQEQKDGVILMLAAGIGKALNLPDDTTIDEGVKAAHATKNIAALQLAAVILRVMMAEPDDAKTILLEMLPSMHPGH